MLPPGTHSLVVRLSAPESHESQNFLTPKDVTDSHQSHCHRQQCPEQHNLLRLLDKCYLQTKGSNGNKSDTELC